MAFDGNVRWVLRSIDGREKQMKRQGGSRDQFVVRTHCPLIAASQASRRASLFGDQNNHTNLEIPIGPNSPDRSFCDFDVPAPTSCT